MSITAPLVKFFGHGNEGRGYLITMTIYGIAAMCIFFLTFASTKEVVPPTATQEHRSLLQDFKGLTGQAWILFLLNLFYFSLYVVRNTTVIYYFKYNLGREDWLTGRYSGNLVRITDVTGAACIGTEIQQEKFNVRKCGAVCDRRSSDLYRQELGSMPSGRPCDHRTWNLWNIRNYICNAAGCDRLFRI